MGLKLVYADPPYLGMGKKMYGSLHKEAEKWDDIQSHIDLMIDMNNKYDGWALSLTSNTLKLLAPNMPEGARIAAWVKPFCSWRPTYRVQYTWEPVIFKEARSKIGWKSGIESVRDHISTNIALKKGLQGAKPDAFNDWLISLLGYQPGDELIDLFPGTNGLSAALDRLKNGA